MNELLSKISSYNIFNNLVPGAFFAISAKKLRIADLTDKDLATNLLIFYLIGMIASRIGSLWIEPLLRHLRLVRYAPYKDFIRYSKDDNKIDVLLEVSNTYRTLGASLVALIAAYVVAAVSKSSVITPFWAVLSGLSLLAIIFLWSYAKQTSYIRRRIEVAAEREKNASS